jgi:hypothetical protein
MKIYWLASYPKSGNTWLRFLIHTYFHGPVIHSKEVEAFIPDLHREGCTLPEDREWCCAKTHFRYAGAHPHIEMTAGFVYLIRHPADVLRSNIYFIYQNETQVPEMPLLLQHCITHMGYKRWREIGMGSWPEHAFSWQLAAKKYPNVFIRFEDLKTDPAAQLRKVVKLLGETPDENRIAQAVENSTFEVMKQCEVREINESDGVFPCPLQEGQAFMRSGKSSGTLEGMLSGADELFWRYIGVYAEHFGYPRSEPAGREHQKQTQPQMA